MIPPRCRRRSFQLVAPWVVGCGIALGTTWAAQPADAPPKRSKPIRVFILAGQSNMTGRAPASGLTAPYRIPPSNVRLDYLCSLGASDSAKSDPSIKPEPHRSDGWVPLQIQPKHTSTPEEHFGPEIGFGHALAQRWPGETIAIIKNGRGATSLAEDWAPDAIAGKHLYADLIGQIRASLDRLKREGRSPEISAFVWVQGEADTTRPAWADDYEKNLTRFIARVRRDLEAPNLPVIVVLTGRGTTNPKMVATPVVRSAQSAVVKRDPRAALVNGDDLGLVDSVHYDAPGQIALGARIADAYWPLRSPP